MVSAIVLAEPRSWSPLHTHRWVLKWSTFVGLGWQVIKMILMMAIMMATMVVVVLSTIMPVPLWVNFAHSTVLRPHSSCPSIMLTFTRAAKFISSFNNLNSLLLHTCLTRTCLSIAPARWAPQCPTPQKWAPTPCRWSRAPRSSSPPPACEPHLDCFDKLAASFEIGSCFVLLNNNFPFAHLTREQLVKYV